MTIFLIIRTRNASGVHSGVTRRWKYLQEMDDFFGVQACIIKLCLYP